MEPKERVVRLAKPMRKGIMRLMFSRFFLIILLLALQVAVLAVAYGWLTERLPVLVNIMGLFSFLMTVYLFNSDMDSTAKLTWMFLIALVPLPGAAMLLFTRTNFGHRLEKRMVDHQIAITRAALPQPPGVLDALARDGSGMNDLCTFLNRSGCFPAYDGTEAVYFPSGEACFAALLEELEKAERYIFLECFIIEEGYMWGRVLDILTRKAAEGVEIRVMYDGMCEMSTLPVGYWKLLEAQGIRAKPFSTIIPVVSSHYNYRDHRKILVIDGRAAFNGGVNMADEYINRTRRFGHWKDAAVMLRGPAAKSYALMFLQMWYIGQEAPDYGTWLRAEDERPANPAGWVMPFGDCPLDEYKAGEAVYMDILNRAAAYVHIMTPYLILDGEMENALRFAAQRGIDVKLILPGVPDKKMAYALAKSHYKSLLKAGVKIYEYTPGFVHAKVFVSDGCKAVVGTINLDYRSLYHHFECAACLYRTPCVREIEADFEATLAKCRAVTPETVKNESLFYKVSGRLMKFVAPLM